MELVLLFLILLTSLFVLTLQVTVLRNRGIEIRRTLRLMGLGGVGFAVLGLGYLLSDIINPFLFSLLIAYALNPVVSALEKRGVKRVVTVGGFAILILAGLVGLLGYSVATTVNNFEAWRFHMAGGSYLDENDSGTWDPGEPIVKKEKREGEPLQTHPGLISSIGTYLTSRFEALPDEWVESTLDRLRRNMETILTGLGQAVGFVSEAVLQRAFRLTSLLVLVPFYTFFLLLGFNEITETVKEHLPARHKKRILSIATKIDRATAAFIRGRVLVMVLKGAVIGLGFSLIGIEFAWTIGLLCAFLNLIPAAGGIVAFGLGLLLSYGPAGWVLRIAGVIGTIIASETVEAVLSPVVIGREVGLHPVSYVLALLVFGKLLGFFGVLLAVPMAAICKVLFIEFLLPEIRNLAHEETQPEQTPGPTDA